MLGDIIGLIILGAIFGALARLFLRGRQTIGIIWTVVLGILGALVGYWIAAALGVASTRGIDWVRDIISVVVSMVFISGFIAIRSRQRV